MIGIYVIENKINNKMYVGQTVNIGRRMYAHSVLSQRKDIMDRAVNKYGWDNFKKHIFCVPENMLDYFEIEMIKRLDTRVPNSEETKQKISRAQKGKKKKPFTEEHKRKLSEANIGKRVGWEHSIETKRKMSIARKQYWIRKKQMKVA